jgi:hypothetical protein
MQNLLESNYCSELFYHNINYIIKKVQTSTELLRAAGEILMFPNNQKVLILSKH